MLNYVEFIEIETVGLASGGDQLTNEAIETGKPDADSQTISRQPTCKGEVQRIVELIKNVMTKRGGSFRWWMVSTRL